MLIGGNLNGVIGSEKVSLLAGIGTFVNKDAGQYKTVTAKDYQITGEDAFNYSLSAQPTDLKGNINKAGLTVKANDGNKKQNAVNPIFTATYEAALEQADKNIVKNTVNVTPVVTESKADVELTPLNSKQGIETKITETVDKNQALEIKTQGGKTQNVGYSTVTGGDNSLTLELSNTAKVETTVLAQENKVAVYVNQDGKTASTNSYMLQMTGKTVTLTPVGSKGAAVNAADNQGNTVKSLVTGDDAGNKVNFVFVNDGKTAEFAVDLKSDGSMSIKPNNDEAIKALKESTKEQMIIGLAIVAARESFGTVQVSEVILLK